MIDLNQWRVSIGAFHAVQSSSAAPRKGSRQAPLVRSRPVEFSISIPILLLALVLLAGDVELNPGPPKIPRKQAALLSQRVFTEFFSRVSKSIQDILDRFAGELLSKNLIALEVLQDLTGALGPPPAKQSNKLLCAVQNKIDAAESDEPFRNFCRVMEKFAVLEDLAREMTERFEFLCSNDSALSDSSSSDEDSTTPRRVSSSTSFSTPADAAAQPSWISIKEVKEYIEYLKNLYFSRPFPIYLKKPFISFHAKKFVNMVVVRKGRIANEKQRDELYHARLHGDADQIRGKKIPLRMEEIGKLEDSSTHCHVLIEGDRGVGKTTFVWELCRHWCQGNALKHCALVVLVQLRQERVRQAKSLSDLLYHCDACISKAVCKEVERASGERVLLILEGFDELSEKQRSERTIFQRIISKELLPLASLIITSRPIAQRASKIRFLEQIDQHVEILGFTSSNIDEYVSSACSDNKSLHEDFTRYIQGYPFACSVMCNPLHCSIVTELYMTYWQEDETGFAPRTVTELYTALVQMLLSRYLHDHSKYGQQEMKLTKFIDLPEDVLQQLRSIAELAATDIEEQQYVFDSVPGGGEELNLMVPVEDVYVPFEQSPSISYSFLHINIQEHLAELHRSQLLLRPKEKIVMQPRLPCRKRTSYTHTLKSPSSEITVQETDQLQTVDKGSQAKDTELQEVPKLIEGSEDTCKLQSLDEVVQVMDTQLSLLEGQVQTVNKMLQAKDTQLQAVQKLMKGSEDELQTVKKIVQVKETQLSQLQDQLQAMQKLIECSEGGNNRLKISSKFLESRIMELEEQVQQLDKVSSAKDTLIEKYKNEYKEELELKLKKSKQQLVSAKFQLKEEATTKLELQQKLTAIQNEEAQLKVSLREKEDKLKTVVKISRAQGVEVRKLQNEMQALKDIMKRRDAEQERKKIQTGTQDASCQANYLALTNDSMLAAEVLAETVIEVTGDGHQSLSWPGHGFRLTVPAGAVPMGTTISLAVKSILTGKFELPESCQLVSAIFWIKASQLFNRDVTLHLHHCGVIESEEQCSRYKFVAGRCSQPDLPYKLVLREGGVFNPHTREASISVKQFSFYAIVGDEASNLLNHGQAFYRPMKGVYVWQFDYVITKYIPSLVENVKEEYEKRGWTEHHKQPVEFEKPEDGSPPSITLSIAERSSRDDKWEFMPITPNQITRQKVDHMLTWSNPPHCLLAVKWRGDSTSRFPDVSRRVDLEGAKRPDHYFSIQLPERGVFWTP